MAICAVCSAAVANLDQNVLYEVCGSTRSLDAGVGRRLGIEDTPVENRIAHLVYIPAHGMAAELYPPKNAKSSLTRVYMRE